MFVPSCANFTSKSQKPFWLQTTNEGDKIVDLFIFFFLDCGTYFFVENGLNFKVFIKNLFFFLLTNYSLMGFVKVIPAFSKPVQNVSSFLFCCFV
jgi:hypothetical protein